jgi:diguanylate cyclase
LTDTASLTLQSAVDLLEAIDGDELKLHYQAIFALPAVELVGFEALVRWDHPIHGLLPPARFLPDEMGTGLGWALTNFVLDEAICACSTWQREGLRAGVAVNIAPGRLADLVLPEYISSVLDHHGVEAPSLTVEITEQRCAVDAPDMQRALQGLSRLGVRISLDDFGTGDSTLARLRTQHFDEIKIDRCFVAGAHTNPADRNIVEFATTLAHSLGMRVVAEGIETAAELGLVTSLGVDLAQGFHLHRPGSPRPFG